MPASSKFSIAAALLCAACAAHAKGPAPKAPALHESVSVTVSQSETPRLPWDAKARIEEMTVSGEPGEHMPAQRTVSTAYLAAVSVTKTDNENVVALTPGHVQSGLWLDIVAQKLDANTYGVLARGKNTLLTRIKEYSVDGNTVQAPDTETRPLTAYGLVGPDGGSFEQDGILYTVHIERR